MSNLLQVSALQSRLDEGKCPVPPDGGRHDRAEAQLEVVQGALRQHEAEVRGATQGTPSLFVSAGASLLVCRMSTRHSLWARHYCIHFVILTLVWIVG